MGFEPMKRLLPSVVQSHGILKQVESRQVVELAGSVLRKLWGDDRSQGVTVVSFNEGTLKLQSVSAPALQHLKLEETKILNAINRELGSRVVLRLDSRSSGF
ncbi:MAG: DciA family protein [Patescibacteria group bacterium]